MFLKVAQIVATSVYIFTQSGHSFTTQLAFNGGHQCSETLTSANGIQVSNFQSYNRNRK